VEEELERLKREHAQCSPTIERHTTEITRLQVSFTLLTGILCEL